MLLTAWPASCGILAQHEAPTSDYLYAHEFRAMLAAERCLHITSRCIQLTLDSVDRTRYTKCHLCLETTMSTSMRSGVSAISETDSSHDHSSRQSEREYLHPRFSYEQDGAEELRPNKAEQHDVAHTLETQYAPVHTTDSEDFYDKKTAPKIHRRPMASLALWTWECIALSLAIASFISIIIILRVYEDRLLSTWGAPLTINAVVSILTTLLKGTLALPVAEGISQLKWMWFSKRDQNLADMELYDSASRGPWGSFLLLWRQILHRQRSYVYIQLY